MKTFLIFATMIISLFGFAGGGGSDSGGGSSYSGGDSYSSSSDGEGEFTWEGFLFTLAIFAICIPIVLIEEKVKERRNHNKYLKEQRELNAKDQNSTKQEKWIHEEAERIFTQYQQDWSDYNLGDIQKYTTDNYFRHASLMLDAIDRMNRRNVVSNLAITRTILYTPVNDETNLPIMVQLMFKFGGTDSLIGVDTKHSIYSNNARGVVEYWDFIYDGESLKLNGITQSTESTPHLIESIAEFAKENNLFYSPDWGRLALPTRGLIFSGHDVLKYADVNNHVVGKWNDCLVQIYTYSAIPGNPNSYYIVGQINVPKSYEGVIVEAKKAKLKVAKPENYDKFDMEWEGFNRRYNVFAASKDALPAFELLNPKFMERLYERNLPYNLEVKDGTIYIFAKVKKAKKEDYAELLNVLSEAFNELRM